MLSTMHASWHCASEYIRFPEARCGHICVAIDKTHDFGTELIVIHGGIDATKAALDDLSVFNVAQEEWLDLPHAAMGPAGRAFHAACVVGTQIYIFAGHVYLPEHKRLHQFNDLWRLDTETWQWHRLEVSPDLPQPLPRDRTSMVALDQERLFIYGGADSHGKRLDDMWVYNLKTGIWEEISVQGTKPKPRCSSSLFSLGNRIMLFGGDSYGPLNDLWSLRGVLSNGTEGNGSWIPLQLDTPPPAPRRGHAAIYDGQWGVVLVGGFSEQKSLLGIKKQPEYLMDVFTLQRQQNSLAWREVECSEGGPKPREKHTLCKLKDGRLLLYGGTDGQTTLGDAWWLTLEDVAPAGPDLISLSDLEQKLAISKEEINQEPLPSPSQAVPSPAPTTSPIASPIPTAPASYWASLPSSFHQSVPALASAMTTIRGRLGFVADRSANEEKATNQSVVTSDPRKDPDQASAWVVDAERDLALCQVGMEVLGSNDSPTTEADLVRAARQYFAACNPNELRIGHIPVLMADYRRLARMGWAIVLSNSGPEALTQPDLALPGRFMHFAAQEVRLKDIGLILTDYKALLQMIT